jgi:hypothetical protein
MKVSWSGLLSSVFYFLNSFDVNVKTSIGFFDFSITYAILQMAEREGLVAAS